MRLGLAYIISFGVAGLLVSGGSSAQAANCPNKNGCPQPRAAPPPRAAPAPRPAPMPMQRPAAPVFRPSPPPMAARPPGNYGQPQSTRPSFGQPQPMQRPAGSPYGGQPQYPRPNGAYGTPQQYGRPGASPYTASPQYPRPGASTYGSQPQRGGPGYGQPQYPRPGAYGASAPEPRRFGPGVGETPRTFGQIPGRGVAAPEPRRFGETGGRTFVGAAQRGGFALHRNPAGRAYMYHGRTFAPFHAARYAWPHGYHFRRYEVGYRLPRTFWVHRYFVNDYVDYGLEAPPVGFQWVRYGPDLLLISLETGEIANAVHGVFEEADDAPDQFAGSYPPGQEPGPPPDQEPGPEGQP